MKANFINKISSFAVIGLLSSLLIGTGQAGEITNTNTQQKCSQKGSDSAPLAPIYNSEWVKQSLNRNIDRKILGVDVHAYKIKWFKGNWSDWYVTGVNDLYPFAEDTNGYPNGQILGRLAWIYFTDHEFQYIYCE